MKKALLVGVSLAVLGAAPAFAADLAARQVYTKAPVVAPIYNWGGFYIGINAGGGWSHNCWNTTAAFGAPVATTSEGCHDASGALVGGQIGYRWQVTNWVFGVEAQGDWANLKGSNTSSPAAFSPVVNQTKIDAIGLFTGQVGYAWNNVLWYVKGGAAVTHDKYTGTTPIAIPLVGIAAGGLFDQASETRWGGAVGTGVEIGFAPGWSVGVEYDHLFMGSHSLTFSSPSPVLALAGVSSRTDSIKQGVDMATVRVNYTFGGPVVAKY
jgi:outer membrane immunogenic protein